jgi:hypothetical protein
MSRLSFADQQKRLGLVRPVLTGVSVDSFKETHACTSIAPGSSCEITVTFALNRSGGKRAGLRIYSNDPDQNPVVVLLRGGALGTYGAR